MSLSVCDLVYFLPFGNCLYHVYNERDYANKIRLASNLKTKESMRQSELLEKEILQKRTFFVISVLTHILASIMAVALGALTVFVFLVVSLAVSASVKNISRIADTFFPAGHAQREHQH